MRFDGARLKTLRVDRKWDQHRLAEAARAHGVGVTQSQISRYENGHEPSGRNVLALAAALDVDARELYGKSGSDETDEDDSDPVTALMHAIRRVVRAEVQAVQA